MKHLFFIIFLLVLATVYAQIPQGYYADAEGKSGEILKAALNDIIDGHTEYSYTSTSTDTWDILKEADRDPANSSNVLCIYSGFSRNAEQEYNGGSGWSREHIWAKSRGDFGTDRGAGTDVHHLRAADVSTNSARSNRNFAYECDKQYVDGDGITLSYTCTNEFSWEPPDEHKGDIARMLYYMATRYEGENGEPDLELTEVLQASSSTAPLHGIESVLLKWHDEDPVSQIEDRRNDVVYSYQGNRNPFIDHPEYVALIWGEEEEEEETTVLSTDNLISEVVIYPNPSSLGLINIKLPTDSKRVVIYDLRGKRVLNQKIRNQNSTHDVSKLAFGQYVVIIEMNAGDSIKRKLIIDKK